MKKRLLFICLSILIIGILIYAIVYFSQESRTLTEETRKEAPGKFIKLSAGMTHYELSGPDTAEVVVFVHGGGSGYFCFDNNAPAIAMAGYRVLRYDLYGRGYSDRVNQTYDVKLFHTQLVELLQALKIDKPVTLVGMSMGAIITINYADVLPDKVKKLVLIDPAALNVSIPPLPLRIPVVKDVLMTVYWYPRAVKNQMSEYYKPENVPEYAGKLEKQMKFKGFKQAIISTWTNTLNKSMEVEMKRIGKHPRPVLLVWGDHDPLVPVEASKEYLKNMPQVTLEIIKNAGHVSCYERPDLVNPVLLGFIKK
jgi:pimeloyl-ACP methyl ester carboxylesterase